MGKIVYQKDKDGNVVYPVTIGDAIAVNGATLTAKVNKLDGIEAGAQKNAVTSVAGKTGAVTLAKSDVGLSNVTNDSQVKRSEMGKANGVATLDAQGKVPSSQLPSYVDDVLEYTASSSFPTTGETGKIYVDTTTNKNYRWGGTAYVEISASIALGETSSTAYAGNKGKANADAIANHKNDTASHVSEAERTAWNAKWNYSEDTIKAVKVNSATKADSATTAGSCTGNAATATNATNHINNTENPHGVTKAQVGLGNVGNFKAVSTVASQGLTATEKSNARANIGAGTSNFSGSYADLTNKPSAATQSAAGFMSANDKKKLDGIAAGANAYTHPDTHAASMITGLATVATTGSYNDLSNKPTSLPASNTTSTYAKTGTAPVNGKAVYAAIGATQSVLTNNTTNYDDSKIAAIVDVAAVDTTIQ